VRWSTDGQIPFRYQRFRRSSCSFSFSTVATKSASRFFSCSTTAAGARSSTPEDLFLGKEVPQSDIVALEPHARALFSFALATSLAAQTASLRADNLFCDRGSVGDAALRLVSSAGAEPFEVAPLVAKLGRDGTLEVGANCSLDSLEIRKTAK